jgi:uncharacterized protein YbbC (DUF1343 family)
MTVGLYDRPVARSVLFAVCYVASRAALMAVNSLFGEISEPTGLRVGLVSVGLGDVVDRGLRTRSYIYTFYEWQDHADEDHGSGSK